MKLTRAPLVVGTVKKLKNEERKKQEKKCKRYYYVTMLCDWDLETLV